MGTLIKDDPYEGLSDEELEEIFDDIIAEEQININKSYEY